MDIRSYTSKSKLRRDIIQEFDPQEEAIENDFGKLKAPGAYVLRTCGECVFDFKSEETDVGDVLIGARATTVEEQHGDITEWFAFDSIDDWIEQKPQVANRFPTEELPAVAAGEKDLYYIGEATVVPDQIWTQLTGKGSTMMSLFPPHTVEHVEWVNTSSYESPSDAKAAVVEQYKDARNAVVIS